MIICNFSLTTLTVNIILLLHYYYKYNVFNIQLICVFKLTDQNDHSTLTAIN